MSAPVDITIYTTRTCPYCRAAKDLLTQKGLSFTEIPVDGDPEARRAMSQRANGRTTVPQIFLNDEHVGGCDDLHELEATGRLDPMLAELATR